MITTYTFNRTGTPSGRPAFTVTGIDGLREKVQQIESSACIPSGFNKCIEIKDAAEAEENSITPFCGPGWYLTKWDGSSVRFDTETEALVAHIENNTDTTIT